MTLLQSITDLVFGRQPSTCQQRRLQTNKRRAEALERMGMGNRPKLNPPPKAAGYKAGDKRKGPLA